MSKKMSATVKKQAKVQKSYEVRIEATGFDAEVRTFGSEAELENFIAKLWAVIEAEDNGEAVEVEAPAPKATKSKKSKTSSTDDLKAAQEEWWEENSDEYYKVATSYKVRRSKDHTTGAVWNNAKDLIYGYLGRPGNTKLSKAEFERKIKALKK